MRFGVIFTALLGIAATAWLVVSVGLRPILSAMLSVGWAGFLVAYVCGGALFAVLGVAWYMLIPRHENPGLPMFIWSRAVRESAGELLPFSQLGGIVIGARALTLRGVDGSLAFASSIVDVTAEMLAQIVFILAGLALLLTIAPRASVALNRSIELGLVAAIVAAALVLVFQRRGVGVISRWGGSRFPRAGAWLANVQRSLADIHASAPWLAASLAIHFCGWIGTALWAWLALLLIGHPISFPFVFTIEAILCGVRSAAVVVPGAIGVQEISYAFLGPLFGLAAPAAIALSLLKRARDLAIGVPVLLAWQFAEGGRALGGGGNSPLKRAGDSAQPFSGGGTR